MIKSLLKKENREKLKEQIEVVFAVITIVSYVSSRIQEKRQGESEREEYEVVCGEVVQPAS